MSRTHPSVREKYLVKRLDTGSGQGPSRPTPGSSGPNRRPRPRPDDPVPSRGCRFAGGFGGSGIPKYPTLREDSGPIRPAMEEKLKETEGQRKRTEDGKVRSKERKGEVRQREDKG